MDKITICLDELEQRTGRLNRFCDKLRALTFGFGDEEILCLLEDIIS